MLWPPVLLGRQSRLQALEAHLWVARRRGWSLVGSPAALKVLYNIRLQGSLAGATPSSSLQPLISRLLCVFF